MLLTETFPDYLTYTNFNPFDMIPANRREGKHPKVVSGNNLDKMAEYIASVSPANVPSSSDGSRPLETPSFSSDVDDKYVFETSMISTKEPYLDIEPSPSKLNKGASSDEDSSDGQTSRTRTSVQRRRLSGSGDSQSPSPSNPTIKHAACNDDGQSKISIDKTRAKEGIYSRVSGGQIERNTFDKDDTTITDNLNHRDRGQGLSSKRCIFDNENRSNIVQSHEIEQG